MTTIYACHCGSTDVRRLAYQDVNYPDDVQLCDTVRCGGCGYEGHSNWHRVELSDDMVDDGWLDKRLLIEATKVDL